MREHEGKGRCDTAFPRARCITPLLPLSARHLNLGHGDRFVIGTQITCHLHLLASVLLQVWKVLIGNVEHLPLADKDVLIASLHAFKSAISWIYLPARLCHGLMTCPAHAVTDFARPCLLSSEA